MVDFVPYERNSMVIFLNTLDSIHSVTARKRASVERRSINIIGEFSNGLSMWQENTVE